MSTFYKAFTSPDERYICVVEDDGRVAYAYLMLDNVVVGDLWLYNQAPATEAPQWHDPVQMPFLNPTKYVDRDTMAKPVLADSEVKVEWAMDGNKQSATVHLFLHGIFYGKLVAGVKPGWSIAAAQNGPLAHRLGDAESIGDAPWGE